MKLTRLIQLGLVGSTVISLTGALSSCTSGVDSLGPDSSGQTAAGPGTFAQAGSQSNPAGNGGAATVGQSGATNIATAGVDSGVGAASQGGVASSTAGNGSGGATTKPCTNLPPNNGDTCAHAVEYDWCKQAWLGESCQKACGKCSNAIPGTDSGVYPGGAAGAGAAGASSGNTGGYGGGGGQPPVIEGGSQGYATRYWDCCKPHCAWKGNVPGGSNPIHSCGKSDQSLGSNYDEKNACDNGGNNGAYMCHDYGPWAVTDKLAYGFAAVNMGDSCGKCFQLQFNGSSHTASSDPGSQTLNGKTMIVQAINTGDIGTSQFDLLIPGGGVGQFDACSAQWGTSDLGERYGGFYLACQKAHGFKYADAKACAAQKCQSVFASRPELLAGCNFFVNWLGAPDNPNLVYKEVACPSAITQMSGLKR